MLLIGLDPSYKEYGVAIIDTDKKIITLDSFGTEINQKKNKTIFDAIPRLMEELDFRILSPLLQNANKHISVGIEVDIAVTARNQAICYTLDYATYNKLIPYKKSFTDLEINFYTTSYIGTIQKELLKEFMSNNDWLSPKINYKKIYTQHLATQVLSYFYYEGWTIETIVTEPTISGPKVKNRYIKSDMMSSGEADAFILALRQFIKSGCSLLKNDISLLLPKLEEDKEID